MLTVVGGIIVLGLFARDWGVSQCIESFCEFGQRIFATSIEQSIGTFGTILAIVRYLTYGGVCSTEVVNTSLQQSFGVQSRLIDRPTGGVTRAKYAVTATKGDDPTAVIFSNYNTPGSSDMHAITKAAHQDDESKTEQGSFPLTTYRNYNGQYCPLVWEA